MSKFSATELELSTAVFEIVPAQHLDLNFGLANPRPQSVRAYASFRCRFGDGAR